ncbi:MAG TPA: hypothetical protein VFQ95_04500 [Rhodanobacteraceae bacterium]|nr:hypothetical protein [Rhodanobacteraceae bacterium]
MRRMVWLLLVVLAAQCAWPAFARAGTYSDQLAQCLIRATTPADQKIVVRWAFATMALDPDVSSMAAVTAAERDAINRKAGALVTTLLAQSCRDPVQQTLMFEGVAGAQSAFEAWGRWAITGLVAEPHVAQGMGALLQYLDMGQLMSLVPLQGLTPNGSSGH